LIFGLNCLNDVDISREELKMSNEKKAAIILDGALEFLATKHGVTRSEIVAAVNAKNVKICEQLATVIAWGIEAV